MGYSQNSAITNRMTPAQITNTINSNLYYYQSYFLRSFVDTLTVGEAYLTKINYNLDTIAKLCGVTFTDFNVGIQGKTFRNSINAYFNSFYAATNNLTQSLLATNPVAWYKSGTETTYQGSPAYTDKTSTNNPAIISTTSNNNDGIDLPISLQTTINSIARGCDFYDELGDTAKPVRPNDWKIYNSKIYGRQKELFIYPNKPSATNFKLLTKYLYNINNFNRYLIKEGNTYVDYNGNDATISGSVIDFNPTNSTSSIFQLFDRRCVVGNVNGYPEIWDAALYTNTNPFHWELEPLTNRHLNQAFVEKYAQGVYKNRIFIEEEKDSTNAIYSIKSVVTFDNDNDLIAVHSLFNWPTDIVLPTIVGNGIADDAVAINNGFSHQAVMIYNDTAIVKTTIEIPSNKYLIIGDAIIQSADSMCISTNPNNNIIRNRNLRTGDVNINLLGFGDAIIDGNGSNQWWWNKALPVNDTLGYKQPVVNFIDVNGITIKGISLKNPARYHWHFQYCQNGLLQNLSLLSTGLNGDGLNINYGSKNIYLNKITGNTTDDFIAMNQFSINYRSDFRDNTKRGRINRIYGENITVTNTSTNVLTFYPSDTAKITNIKFRDINSISAGRNIAFRNYGMTVTGICIKDVDVKNLKTNLGTVYFFDASVENFTTSNIKASNYYYMIYATPITIKNSSINTILHTSPPTTLFFDEGATLTNFTHNETIHY